MNAFRFVHSLTSAIVILGLKPFRCLLSYSALHLLRNDQYWGRKLNGSFPPVPHQELPDR
jgi:hypothetical protein